MKGQYFKIKVPPLKNDRNKIKKEELVVMSA